MIIGIAHSAPDQEIQALIAEQGLTFRNLYDPDQSVPNAYEVGGGVPIYVFLDKEGRIARRFVGDVNWLKDGLIELMWE